VQAALKRQDDRPPTTCMKQTVKNTRRLTCESTHYINVDLDIFARVSLEGLVDEAKVSPSRNRAGAGRNRGPRLTERQAVRRPEGTGR
jgi:hypothetical protein